MGSCNLCGRVSNIGINLSTFDGIPIGLVCYKITIIVIPRFEDKYCALIFDMLLSSSKGTFIECRRGTAGPLWECQEFCGPFPTKNDFLLHSTWYFVF